MALAAGGGTPRLALRPREAGQSLVELALAAPVLVALLLGVVSLTTFIGIIAKYWLLNGK